MPSAEKTESKYTKVKDFHVPTYEEAVKLADDLFAPYGERDSSGSRTTSLGKVRIKALKAVSGFKVVLYKRSVKVEKDSTNGLSTESAPTTPGNGEAQEVSGDGRKSRPRGAKRKDKRDNKSV